MALNSWSEYSLCLYKCLITFWVSSVCYMSVLSFIPSKGLELIFPKWINRQVNQISINLMVINKNIKCLHHRTFWPRKSKESDFCGCLRPSWLFKPALCIKGRGGLWICAWKNRDCSRPDVLTVCFQSDVIWWHPIMNDTGYRGTWRARLLVRGEGCAG